MTIRIRISLKRVQSVIGRIPKRMHANVVQTCRETAMFGRTAVQQIIAQSAPLPVATGTYRNGWKVQETPDGAMLVNRTKQAYFVEFGRRPGKMPPEGPILQWLRVKGFAADVPARSLAWLVRRKIAREGTKGRFVLQRAQPLIRKYFDRQLKTNIKNMRPPR